MAGNISIYQKGRALPIGIAIGLLTLAGISSAQNITVIETGLSPRQPRPLPVKKTPPPKKPRPAFEVVEPLDEAKGLAAKRMKQALPPQLKEMFPVGRVFKGVVVPSYKGDAVESVMTATTVKRINQRFLLLTDLVIDFYSNGAKDTSIEMDRARYDLITGILASQTPANIEQEQFTMTGNQLVFETETRKSRVVGNVRVLIPDSGGLAGRMQQSKSEDPPSSESQ